MLPMASGTPGLSLSPRVSSSACSQAVERKVLEIGSVASSTSQVPRWKAIMPGSQGLPTVEQSLPSAPAVLRSALLLQSRDPAADGHTNASYLLPLRNGDSQGASFSYSFGLGHFH